MLREYKRKVSSIGPVSISNEEPSDLFVLHMERSYQDMEEELAKDELEALVKAGAEILGYSMVLK